MKLRKIIPKKNKRGAITDLVLWMIVSFVVAVFFALWVYGFNLITETLQDVPSTTDLNVSKAADDTFGQLNRAQTSGLQTLAYVMIIASILTILISNFLVKAHPVFFIVYLMVIIGCFIGSVYISNYYEDLMQDAVLGTTFQDFTASSWIMLNLPIFIVVVGVFGAIFLFAGIMVDKGQGGGVL